jgi:hypothetical protein
MELFLKVDYEYSQSEPSLAMMETLGEGTVSSLVAASDAVSDSVVGRLIGL